MSHSGDHMRIDKLREAQMDWVEVQVGDAVDALAPVQVYLVVACQWEGCKALLDFAIA